MSANGYTALAALVKGSDIVTNGRPIGNVSGQCQNPIRLPMGPGVLEQIKGSWDLVAEPTYSSYQSEMTPASRSSGVLGE
jgi:hypothetical protein